MRESRVGEAGEMADARRVLPGERAVLPAQIPRHGLVHGAEIADVELVDGIIGGMPPVVWFGECPIPGLELGRVDVADVSVLSIRRERPRVRIRHVRGGHVARGTVRPGMEHLDLVLVIPTDPFRASVGAPHALAFLHRDLGEGFPAVGHVEESKRNGDGGGCPQPDGDAIAAHLASQGSLVRPEDVVDGAVVLHRGGVPQTGPVSLLGLHRQLAFQQPRDVPGVRVLARHAHHGVSRGAHVRVLIPSAGGVRRGPPARVQLEWNVTHVAVLVPADDASSVHVQTRPRRRHELHPGVGLDGEGHGDALGADPYRASLTEVDVSGREGGEVGLGLEDAGVAGDEPQGPGAAGHVEGLHAGILLVAAVDDEAEDFRARSDGNVEGDPFAVESARGGEGGVPLGRLRGGFDARVPAVQAERERLAVVAVVVHGHSRRGGRGVSGVRRARMMMMMVAAPKGRGREMGRRARGGGAMGEGARRSQLEVAVRSGGGTRQGSGARASTRGGDARRRRRRKHAHGNHVDVRVRARTTGEGSVRPSLWTTRAGRRMP